MKIPRRFKEEFRWHNDGDDWGRCLSFHFALCDYMHDRCMEVPDRWRYKRGLSSDKNECYRVFSRLRYSESTLIHIGDCLSRLAEILSTLGRSY